MNMCKKTFLLIPVLFCLPLLTVFAQKKHTVVPGNTLSGLAQQYYNDFKKWPAIHDANKDKDLELAAGTSPFVPKRILNPNLIYPCQILIIPNIADDKNAATSGTADEKYKNLLIGDWGDDPMLSISNNGRFSQNDKSGTWTFKGDLLTLEGMGVYLVDLKQLELGALVLTPVKDAQGKEVKNAKSSTMKKRAAKMPDQVKIIDVKGKVLSQGKGVAGAKVEAVGYKQTATVAADGSFTLTQIPVGTALNVTANGYKTNSTTAAENVSINLEQDTPAIATRNFKGKVVFFKKQGSKKPPLPAAKATVTLIVNGKEVRSMNVKGDGTFEFTAIKNEFNQQVEIVAKLLKFGDKRTKAPDTQAAEVDLGTIELFPAPKKKKK
jgi:LysM repeat protein